jgi:hypothetical protein
MARSDSLACAPEKRVRSPPDIDTPAPPSRHWGNPPQADSCATASQWAPRRWGATRLRIDSPDLDGGPPASRPAGALERPLPAHDAEAGRPRRPGGRPGHVDREMARRPRFLPDLPPVTRRWRGGEPPMALRPAAARRPVLRHPPPGLPKPLRTLPVPIRHVHDARVRTALLDLARQLIPCQPAGPLLLFARLAFALVAHWRRGALPPRGSQDASGDACGGQGSARLAQGLLAALALHRPHPRLLLRGAVMQKRGILDEHDHLLRPAPVPRRVLMARQHRRRANRRVVQTPLCRYGLRPTVTGPRHPGHGVLTAPCSPLPQPLRVARSVDLTRTPLGLYPMAHRCPPPRGN